MKFELPTTFEDDDEDEDVFYDPDIRVEEAVARTQYGTEMRAAAVVGGREEAPDEKPKTRGSSTLEPNHTTFNNHNSTASEAAENGADDEDDIVLVGVRPAPLPATGFQQPPPSSSIPSTVVPLVTADEATPPSSRLSSAVPQQLVQQLKQIFAKVTTPTASRSATAAAVAGIDARPSHTHAASNHQNEKENSNQQQLRCGTMAATYCDNRTPEVHHRRRPSYSSRLPRPHEFTVEERTRIQQILHVDHNDDDDDEASTILLSHPTPSRMLRRASLHSLRPKVWLQDEPVNYYVQVVLTQRDRQLCDQDPTRKRSHFFNSFFVTELLKQYDNNNNNPDNNNTKNETRVVVDIDDPDVVNMDIDGDGIHNDTGTTGTSFRSSLNRGSTTSSNTTYRYDYKSVARWSKKVPLKDIFDLDKLFFPINVSNVHWILGIVDMTKKQILILDSLVENEEAVNARTEATVMADRYAYALFQYVLDEYRDKKQVHLPEAHEWKIITSSSWSSATNKITTASTTRTTIPTPQQRNDYDCGVFLCYFATCVSIDVPITSVDQGYITEYYGRERIVLSILNGTVVL